jgi:hypothetical protein
MNKWEQFEHIVKKVLHTYSLTQLSCQISSSTSYPYKTFSYGWELQINEINIKIYDELLTISYFCGIEWNETIFDEGKIKIRLTEHTYEYIEPVYW